MRIIYLPYSKSLNKPYALISYKNDRGEYDEVGMSNRCPITHLKTLNGVIKSAKKDIRAKKGFKILDDNDNVLAEYKYWSL